MQPLTTKKRYTVAFLAGDGIGPELTAQASRALQEAARLHGFRIDEVHPPFGGEALARYGHRLPEPTRVAYRDADAILVATTRDPAIEGVKADLDLTLRIQRVGYAPRHDLTIVSPLVDEAEGRAAGRAFNIAHSRSGRLVSVGQGEAWAALVAAHALANDGIDVEQLALEAALPRIAADSPSFSVIATQRLFADAVSDMAAFNIPGSRNVASGRLPDHGPGVFGPTHGSAMSIAGQGVANPSGILLAASLLLSEGLGERPAGHTLEQAMGAVVAGGTTTPDHEGEIGATTRSFTDAVLGMMPSARTDIEFFAEVRS